MSANSISATHDTDTAAGVGSLRHQHGCQGSASEGVYTREPSAQNGAHCGFNFKTRRAPARPLRLPPLSGPAPSSGFPVKLNLDVSNQTTKVPVLASFPD